MSDMEDVKWICTRCSVEDPCEFIMKREGLYDGNDPPEGCPMMLDDPNWMTIAEYDALLNQRCPLKSEEGQGYG
jgi:hypothetical protein